MSYYLPFKPSDFFCQDCGVDTSLDDRNYYMLKDYIWDSIFSGSGCLCVHCAEKRLGRHFIASDLSLCFLNIHMNPYTRQILSS